MGLLDKVKGLGKEMGIGLNAQEQYDRAYVKGVLLQPPDYASAAKHFATASEKFMKEGNQSMAQRAQANATLYGLISTHDHSGISEVIKNLQSLPEIECIGKQNEMVKTESLIDELTALQCEYQAETNENNIKKKEEYAKASNTFMKLGTSPLPIAEKLQVKGPLDKAMLRAYYCTALSEYYSACAIVLASPTEAHNSLQKAALSFRQANDNEWSKTVDDYIIQVKSKSHCWMCGREMQGKDIFYKYYPAQTEEFHSRLLKDVNQDLRMIDNPGSITICTVCGSAIENQADRYATMRANEVREWVTPILHDHEEAIKALAERIRHLESAAHRH